MSSPFTEDLIDDPKEWITRWQPSLDVSEMRLMSCAIWGHEDGHRPPPPSDRDALLAVGHPPQQVSEAPFRLSHTHLLHPSHPQLTEIT